jgi:LacI family transcriptional regulator
MATIYDVARAAGVSTATVSRALNSPGRVAVSTRERILAIAERLDYRPSALAQALSHGHSRTIAVLLPEPEANPYYHAVIEEVDHRTRAMGYEMVVTFLHEGNRSGLRDAIRALESRRPAGYLVCGEGNEYEEYEHLRAAGCAPAVWVCPCPGKTVSVVCPDEEQAGYLATRHLLDLGHVRIAFACVTHFTERPEPRESGYLRALAEAGAEPVFAGLAGGAPAGRSAAVELVDNHPDVTAILARNDHTAFGVLTTLRERGISVPDQVSVVGFDDIPLAQYSSPPLTTVDMRVEETTKRALSKLLTAVRGTGKQTATHETVTPRLVVRASSGPVRAACGPAKAARPRKR